MLKAVILKLNTNKYSLFLDQYIYPKWWDDYYGKADKIAHAGKQPPQWYEHGFWTGDLRLDAIIAVAGIIAAVAIYKYTVKQNQEYLRERYRRDVFLDRAMESKIQRVESEDELCPEMREAIKNNQMQTERHKERFGIIDERFLNWLLAQRLKHGEVSGDKLPPFYDPDYVPPFEYKKKESEADSDSSSDEDPI